MDTIERSLFINRIQSACEEMGAVLQYTAFSPNIRDRLDFSCAVFDAAGELCAQAAHIPVHLGSMAYAMRDIVRNVAWRPGDMIILNDPFLGGTHLPDITLIAPVFVADTVRAFVANRAHHADVGAITPGSMPLSTRLDEEGLVIPPRHLLQDGKLLDTVMADILQNFHAPAKSTADLKAQISANKRGIRLVSDLIQKMGTEGFLNALTELNDYAERLAYAGIDEIPAGCYEFSDKMDDDGHGNMDITIHVKVNVARHRVVLDFTGTDPQVEGNINCPLSVTAAAVYYCFHCLMPPQTPPCAGSFRPLEIIAPAGCLVNARPPAAVAAGNVETSMRLVDVVLGALAQAIPEQIPAASQGTMNNIALGTNAWDYYETIGGGMGAGPRFHGEHARQSHMTNTLNTPIEIVEMHYPLRIRRYAIRRGSGGRGHHHGGDGIIREYDFLENTSVTILSERRRYPPWGLNQGRDGTPGINSLNGRQLPGKARLAVQPGDRLIIATPGGGGWGEDKCSG